MIAKHEAICTAFNGHDDDRSTRQHEHTHAFALPCALGNVARQRSQARTHTTNAATPTNAKWQLSGGRHAGGDNLNDAWRACGGRCSSAKIWARSSSVIP
ncbi:hypothetical protein [Dyella sp.]|uniref:hypothetical protein n=1 Tax=Dyella sp. TaxID=1869338 RepID=UPI00284490F4|nr:hypothetical protein [Dyella sp.]MDR3444711.1 hypothetical protein [Dyella sp.]